MSDPHVLTVLHTDLDSEEPRYELEHPPRCILWVGYRDGVQFDSHYECEVTTEIDNVGAFSMLEGLEPGRYHVWLRPRKIVGPTEYDYQFIPTSVSEWQIEAAAQIDRSEDA